jgi:SAM-dependent methyltransferase
MRNAKAWHPTKFVMIDGRLHADPTGTHIPTSSRIVADLVAGHYEAALRGHARGRLLDLGCGNVPLLEVYRTYVEDIVCVDWPASLHQQQHVDIFADVAQSVPLRDGSFDTVVLTDVLEHVPVPETLIGEIARVLRPTGRAIIGVPFFYWLHETPRDFNRYTRFQLERLCEHAGLEVLQLVEIGGSPEVIADVVGKSLASRRRLAATFVTIASWLLRRSVVRRASEKTRSLFPISYLLVAEKPGNLETSAVPTSMNCSVPSRNRI